MKRTLVWLATAALAALPARANLRAPIKVDGIISGGLKTMLLDGTVTLLGEELKIVFPEFAPRLDHDKASASVTVRYAIENAAAGPVTVPVKFLAVEISGLAAKLNGELVPCSLCPDPPEKAECLMRLSRHRAEFLPELYRGFLSEVRQAAGLKDAPEGEWLALLEKADLGSAPFRDLFPRTFGGGENEADFRRAGLELPLKPGLNTLEIKYRQRVFVDERGHGYFAAWPKKGFTGLDYLLYPAASWPRRESFKLTVEVEVPDLREKRLLGPAWRRAFVRSNPALRDVASRRPRRVLRGEFSSLPADILTVIVWFDKKAAGYLSPAL